MKFFGLLIFCAAVAAAAEVRAFLWQESRDEKTAEREFGFFVGPPAVQKMMEAEARGDRADVDNVWAKIPPAEAWCYGLLLSGERKQYSDKQISIMRLDGHEMIDVVSGTVELDAKKRVAKINLKVMVDGKAVPFPGNGVFTVTEFPKR